jgi:hypothetical protein
MQAPQWKVALYRHASPVCRHPQRNAREQEKPTKDFREQRRRKQNSSDEQATKSKKTVMPTPAPRDPKIHSQDELPTRNFFAPLRATEIDVEHTLVGE